MRFAPLLALLTACPSASSNPCDCGATEFCCIDHCLPFGASCAPDGAPLGDAPLADAPAPIDCSPRATPEGGSAPSLSRCVGNAVWWCSGEPASCNPGYGCIEWLDEVAGAFRAACTDQGRAACDPAAGPRCDGTQLLTCAPTGLDREDAPPGLVVAVDCPAAFGPSSTCATDGEGAHCSAEACDPAAHVATCTGDTFTTCTDGALRLSTCADELQCLVNDLTAPGATCIPRGARESTVRSAERQVIGCTGEALLVAQYGYEWGEACDGGWVCRTTAAGSRCADPAAATCDEASFVPSCADGIQENRCVLGLVTPWYCGIALLSGSVPSACDPDTGACVPTTFCGGPHVDRCDDTRRYRLHCDDTHGREVASPCAGCSDAPGGATCG